MKKDFRCNVCSKHYGQSYMRDKHEKQCKEKTETLKRRIAENPKFKFRV